MSFFQKLRRLPDNSQEDYLTEIFDFAMQQDRIFREHFLRLLPPGYQQQDGFTVETQCVYQAEGRRTDIEINLGHAYLIIESKLGSTESYGQLDDYARLLSQKNQPHKLLVFLTVNRETKDEGYTHLGVDFMQLRWYDIGPCITDKCDTITQELKHYLKAEKILMDKITYNDIVTFQQFFETRKKLNDILRNDVSRLYVEKGLHSFNTYQPTVRTNEYVLQFNYGKRQEANVVLGFGNWWGEHPCLFIRLWVSNKKDPEGATATSAYEQLKQANWYLLDSTPGGYAVEYREPLLGYLQHEENQRTKLVEFFAKCIGDLASITGAP
ncbi:MAG: PD-(D/E)XK nuclease family protein, partial [Pontibacter sp.]|nr:PD-(D/E)XK nuclease family protein [Pontibacter sp.]